MANIYVGKTGLKGAAGNDSLTRATQNAYNPLLTLQRAEAVRLAGDNIFMRAGTYREGELDLLSSGAASAYREILPFTNQTAILTGAELLTGWTQCTTQAEAGGNPNYANIYYAYIPSAYAAGLSSINLNLHQDGAMCYMAQTPTQSDPFFWRNDDEYVEVPIADISTTQLTDSTNLTSGDSAFYDHSYVCVRTSGDRIFPRKITNFNPSTDTITYNTLAAAVATYYPNTHGLYSIVGGPTQISQAGEFACSYTLEGNGTRLVWFWPNQTADMSNIEISIRKYGINTAANSYIKVGNKTAGGLHIQQFAGDSTDADGMCVGKYTNTGTSNTGLEVSYCTLKNNLCYSSNGRGEGAVRCRPIHSANIHDNIISRNQGMDAWIFYQSNDCRFVDNQVTRTGHSFGTNFYSRRLQITGNILDGHRDVHANIITTYLQSGEVLIANNIFRNINERGSMTFSEMTGDMWIFGNLWDCGNGNVAINEWSDVGTTLGITILVANNTIAQFELNSSYDCAVAIYNRANWKFINNATAGGMASSAVYEHRYNGYIDTCSQDGTLDPTEFSITSADFDNYANGDYHPAALGNLVDAGVDISAYLADAMTYFPDFDFTATPDGGVRSLTAPSIGCYEAA